MAGGDLPRTRLFCSGEIASDVWSMCAPSHLWYYSPRVLVIFSNVVLNLKKNNFNIIYG